MSDQFPALSKSIFIAYKTANTKTNLERFFAALIAITIAGDGRKVLFKKLDATNPSTTPIQAMAAIKIAIEIICVSLPYFRHAYSYGAPAQLRLCSCAF